MRSVLLTLIALATAPLANAQNSSVFTSLNLNDCDVWNVTEYYIDEETLVEQPTFACQGYGGADIYVTEGDLRFDVDAGVPNDLFQTAFFFNEPHTTVEWRIDAEEEPFALIHRFWSTDPEFKASVLAVTKVGWPGTPGCTVALISGSLPNANERATQLADAIIDRVDCNQVFEALIIN